MDIAPTSKRAQTPTTFISEKTNRERERGWSLKTYCYQILFTDKAAHQALKASLFCGLPARLITSVFAGKETCLHFALTVSCK